MKAAVEKSSFGRVIEGSGFQNKKERMRDTASPAEGIFAKSGFQDKNQTLPDAPSPAGTAFANIRPSFLTHVDAAEDAVEEPLRTQSSLIREGKMTSSLATNS